MKSCVYYPVVSNNKPKTNIMTTQQLKSINALETQINAALKSRPDSMLPKLARTRRSIVSVAYSAAGFFEATDINGITDSVKIETAKGWL